MRGYRRKRKTAPGMIMLCAALLLVVTLAAFAFLLETAAHDPVFPEGPGASGALVPTDGADPVLSVGPSADPTQTAAESPVPTGGTAPEPSAGPSVKPAQTPEFPP